MRHTCTDHSQSLASFARFDDTQRQNPHVGPPRWDVRWQPRVSSGSLRLNTVGVMARNLARFSTGELRGPQRRTFFRFDKPKVLNNLDRDVWFGIGVTISPGPSWTAEWALAAWRLSGQHLGPAGRPAPQRHAEHGMWWRSWRHGLPHERRSATDARWTAGHAAQSRALRGAAARVRTAPGCRPARPFAQLSPRAKRQTPHGSALVWCSHVLILPRHTVNSSDRKRRPTRKQHTKHTSHMWALS